MDAPAEPGLFRPRLTLLTLTRGDGLLGLRAVPGFGPRGAQLSAARVDWAYRTADGLAWETPAPDRLLNTRSAPTVLLRGAWTRRVTLQRDARAEGPGRHREIARREPGRPAALALRR